MNDNDDHLIGPDMRRAAPTGTPGMYRVRLIIREIDPETPSEQEKR